MQQDGAYLFPSVPEGRYALRLSGAPADVYAAGFRLNGKPLPEAIFDVGSEGLKSPLEIVLSPGAGSIRGTVSDSLGTPVPQALVALVPSKAQPRVPLFSLDTRTDSTGSFVLQNIAPGEYTLFAWEHAQSSSWQDPDFLRIVEPVGRRVVVTSAPQTDVQLTAIPGEPLP
jgi:hypothetical protein